ncbi:SLC13 family permease [Edaphovirga cremea]|uniref:SLC13 family permease n=1 Tax=Edaphovirga cremea TaxID=2267246 RepID=UPI000DEF052F|nr:DASS family sodium-coupled anion symporter [Edaphovirga cremea]
MKNKALKSDEHHPSGVKNGKPDSWMKKYGFYLAAICFLLLYFMPQPAGLPVEGQKAIAIFVFALIMWVTCPVPIFITSLIVIILLSVTGTWSEKNVLGTLGYDVIWLMVSAFVLTSAMIKSNLARRFALFMVTRFGKTPKKTLFILVFINFALAFFVPSTTARATLMVPICIILLEVYKAIPGESNLGRVMMLQGVQADALATSGVMTATAGNIIAVGFINDLTGSSIGYMDWLLAGMPTAIITMAITFFIGLRLFSFKGEATFSDGIGRLSSELNSMGNISTIEFKTLTIFLITVVLWATSDYHQDWVGFKISVYMTAIMAATWCLLPRFGILSWPEANIKWDLMLFAAGAYAAGNALEKTKGAEWLIGKVVTSLGLENMSHTAVYILVIFISMYSHLIFTSKTVRVTILIPSFIALAKTLGMDPVGLALAAALTTTYTITLPPHSKVNAIYFSTGFFSVLDQIKYAMVTCFIGACVISITLFTWFKVLGLFTG